MAHPDRHGGDTRAMVAVNIARDILTDPARRERFDLGGEDVPPTPPLELRARIQLAGAFMQVLQQPQRQNIPAAAKRLLTQTRANALAQKREMAQITERLRTRLKEVEFKGADGEPNVFADQVNAMLAQLTEQTRQRDETIEAIDRAQVLLANYRSGVMDSAAYGGFSIASMLSGTAG